MSKATVSKTKPAIRLAILMAAFVALIGGVVWFVPSFGSSSVYLNQKISQTSSTVSANASSTPTVPSVTHLATPKTVRAIYMTACAASSQTFRQHFFNLLKTTNINAVVINIKDETGKVSIKTDNPNFIEPYETSGCPVSDMEELVRAFHAQNIYVIARIAVFQDPYLVKKHPEWAVKRASDGAVWKDRKGISWLEVKATPVWDYVAALAKESYNIGFDEINLDYIRFPSDGDMTNIAYSYYQSVQETKAEAVKDFFAGMHERLKNLGAPISVDLFGMTCTNTDDLGIGQVLENALPYFDYVAPMVYPSHYPTGWNGYQKPATVPYQVIKFNLDAAVQRARAASSSPEKIRPWLQDFDLGADYTAEMIRSEIQAVHDAGLSSYFIWDPKNQYTQAAYTTKTVTATTTN